MSFSRAPLAEPHPNGPAWHSSSLPSNYHYPSQYGSPHSMMPSIQLAPRNLQTMSSLSSRFISPTSMVPVMPQLLHLQRRPQAVVRVTHHSKRVAAKAPPHRALQHYKHPQRPSPQNIAEHLHPSNPARIGIPSYHIIPASPEMYCRVASRSRVALLSASSVLAPTRSTTTSSSKISSRPSEDTSEHKRARLCRAGDCSNSVVQGGVCIAHGAKRKQCGHADCTKNVKKGGLCSTHGPARKKCLIEDCTKIAVQGGICIGHGAKKALCSREGCTKRARSTWNHMCKRHFDQGTPDIRIEAARRVARLAQSYHWNMST